VVAARPMRSPPCVDIPSSRVTLFPPKLNANTRLPGALPSPAVSPASLHDAYELAVALFAGTPPTAVAGYRLYWMRGTRANHNPVRHSYPSVELPAIEGAFSVVGRHTQCHPRLELDAEIALRHLLMRAVLTPDGPVLHALDLHTSLAFHLEDETPQRSVFARGPVALRLGRYALIALPTGGEPPPKELPPLVVEHAVGSPYRSPAPRSKSTSHVTLMPASRPLHESGTGMVPPDFEGATHTVARVSLESGDNKAWVDLSEPELERGVLIGRASKCDPRLGPLLDESISRAHLLLWRERDRVFAFDLASMNGTFVDATRVGRVELTDRDVTLQLGSHGLRLFWRPRRG
jgi:hypothetical protein